MSKKSTATTTAATSPRKIHIPCPKLLESLAPYPSNPPTHQPLQSRPSSLRNCIHRIKREQVRDCSLGDGKKGRGRGRGARSRASTSNRPAHRPRWCAWLRAEAKP